MPFETKILIALASLLITLTIIGLVRKKRLDEKYALLWLAVGALMMLAPLATPIIDAMSTALGFHYPPAFVFLLAFLGLCLINLQFSVVISRLTKQNRALAQRFAILEESLRDVKRQSRE
jgi:hypothetical protein